MAKRYDWQKHRRKAIDRKYRNEWAPRTTAGPVTTTHADGTETTEPAYGGRAERRVLAGAKVRRTPVPGPLREAVIERDGFRCRYCGKACEHGYEIDHIEPLARGGANELENLAMACRKCNRAKGTELWQPRRPN